MVTYHDTDLLNADASKLIPVNCIPGVMGAGLAKQAAQKEPGLRKQHKILCEKGFLKPGKPIGVGRYNQYILFPTKNHWRKPSQLDWIYDGLHRVKGWQGAGLWPPHPEESIAIPALGCGLGGLNWDTVHDMILDIFSDHEKKNLHIMIYPPQGEYINPPLYTKG